MQTVAGGYSVMAGVAAKFRIEFRQNARHMGGIFVLIDQTTGRAVATFETEPAAVDYAMSNA